MLQEREPELFDMIVTLLSVRDGCCRFPVAEKDGELFLCGNPIFLGHNYCKDHCRLVYSNFGQANK